MIAILMITGAICLLAGLLLTTLMRGQYEKWIDDIELKEDDVQ